MRIVSRASSRLRCVMAFWPCGDTKAPKLSQRQMNADERKGRPESGKGSTLNANERPETAKHQSRGAKRGGVDQIEQLRACAPRHHTSAMDGPKQDRDEVAGLNRSTTAPTAPGSERRQNTINNQERASKYSRSTGAAGRAARDLGQVHVGAHGHFRRVQLQDLLPPAHIGQRHLRMGQRTPTRVRTRAWIG